MERTILKTTQFLILCIFILMHNSCNDSEKDISKVDSSFVLQTNDSIKNKQALNLLKEKINSFTIEENTEVQELEQTKSQTTEVEELGLTKSQTTKGASEKAIFVSLKDEVAKLFDPENHPCSLPAKIAKKLRNSKNAGEPWIPKFVNNYISKMPDTVLYIPRQSISNILHTVTIKKIDSNHSFIYLVSGSPTYNDLNVEDFILSGYDSFLYSLDCSGYLNAAIEGSATIPGADINAAAKSALETQNSMFIGGGIIVSPLCAAYYGNSLVSMDTLTRIRILSALSNIPNASDNDIVDINYTYDAVWASKTGTSSFNGEADIKTSGGAGFGVAKISISASAGGAISRKSKFSSFNTYITKDQPLINPEEITISQIKTRIQDLKSKH